MIIIGCTLTTRGRSVEDAAQNWRTRRIENSVSAITAESCFTVVPNRAGIGLEPDPADRVWEKWSVCET